MKKRSYVLIIVLSVFAALLILTVALGWGRKFTSSEPPQVALRPPVAVEVVAASSGDVVEGIEVVGSLSPKYQAEVKAELPGLVSEVRVTEWVRVRKGDLLARMDSSELEVLREKARAAVQVARTAEEAAKAALLEATVAAERAEREYNRLLQLKEAGFVTQQAVDDGRSGLEASRARIRVVQAQIASAQAQTAAVQKDVQQVEAKLAKAAIKAPMDGVIARRAVNVGDLPGDHLIFLIVDNRLLDLTVTVPSGEMGKVRVGQPLTFTVDAYPGRTFTGKVSFINPTVNVADRSVRLTAEVSNVREELKGGLFVKGYIATGKRVGVVRVPRSALFNWDVAGGKADLFLVENNAARRRTVSLGALEDDLAEIREGLLPGDRVVVRGGFNLQDGAPVKVFGDPSKVPSSGPYSITAGNSSSASSAMPSGASPASPGA
jgi:RND family efflux transporter MFP subunit